MYKNGNCLLLHIIAYLVTGDDRNMDHRENSNGEFYMIDIRNPTSLCLDSNSIVDL